MTADIALLGKDPASDYGIEFPDLPAGETPEDASRMAAEPLARHVTTRPLPINPMLPVAQIDHVPNNRARFLKEAARPKLTSAA